MTRASKISLEEVQLTRIPLFHLYADLLISIRLIDAAATWADIIILHHGQGMAIYAWRKHGIPCIPFFHTNNFDGSLYGRLQPIVQAYTFPLKILQSDCLEKVPIAFVNSLELRTRVKADAKDGRLEVIPLGVDTSKFYPTEKDEGFIFMAGRYHPTNNFELGIAAVEGTPYRLVIAGVQDSKNKDYHTRLEGWVKDSQDLSGRVQFTSPSEDEYVSYLQRCSIFLSPRRYAYLGLAALEAMACGKPVIAFDPRCEIEGSPPIVACGDNPRDWRSAISKLMGDSNGRRVLGNKSFSFVNENHTWRKTVTKMLQFVDEVYGQRLSERIPI
jgi:glycosyltransferase involved in cell wall biosynthesis